MLTTGQVDGRAAIGRSGRAIAQIPPRGSSSCTGRHGVPAFTTYSDPRWSLHHNVEADALSREVNVS